MLDIQSLLVYVLTFFLLDFEETMEIISFFLLGKADFMMNSYCFSIFYLRLNQLLPVLSAHMDQISDRNIFGRIIKDHPLFQNSISSTFLELQETYVLVS